MTTLRAESGDLMDIRPYGDRFAQASSATLVKADQLDVIRMVLPAGKKIPSHQVPGAITVQCLEGAVGFESPGRT